MAFVNHNSKDFPPVLHPTEQERLFTIMDTGAPWEAVEARETLIASNLRLVNIALRRYPMDWYDKEESWQHGVIGLMEAVDKHELVTNSFSAFAMFRIHAEIAAYKLKRSFAVTIDRDRARLYHKILKTYQGLRMDEHYDIGEAVTWCAVHYELDEESVTYALAVQSLYSLDDDDSKHVEEYRTTGSATDDPSALDPVREAVRQDTHNRLDRLVESLPFPEPDIIRMRLGMGEDDPDHQTLQEISDSLGVPRKQTTVLENLAFARLRHPSRAGRLV
jgi:RNA polymerase primary sigma factor